MMERSKMARLIKRNLRRLEEVYAYKSVISETLTSYPELLTQKEVGDQLTSEAASVIFSPAETEKLYKSSMKNYKLDDIKELIEIATRVSKGT